MADIVCGECSEEITKDDGDTVFYCNSCKQYFHEKCVIDADGQYCPYCSDMEYARGFFLEEEKDLLKK